MTVFWEFPEWVKRRVVERVLAAKVMAQKDGKLSRAALRFILSGQKFHRLVRFHTSRFHDRAFCCVSDSMCRALIAACNRLGLMGAIY